MISKEIRETRESRRIYAKIKSKPPIWLGASAGAVCMIGLMSLLAVRLGDTQSPIKSGKVNCQNSSCTERVVPSGGPELSNKSAISGVAPDSMQNPMNEYQDGKLTDDFDETQPDRKYTENGEGIIEPDMAAIKEDYIRARFGTVRRGGKWIPTAWGGSNLVYITTGSLTPGRLGEIYDVSFHAVSGTPPYHWSLLESDLPESFSFDPVAGRLTGIPVEPDTLVFYIGVTDARGARDLAEYVLVIQPEDTLEIATENLPVAFPGNDYYYRLQAAGGVPPYTWSAEGSAEEIGALFLDSFTGEIYGTIGDFTDHADIPIEIRLNDSQISVSKQLTLHIRTGLSILDAPDSSLRESEPFSFAFRAAGGLEPYIWSSVGALPPGLDLSESGVLAGRPAEPGLYQVSVRVKDQWGGIDTAQFPLKVEPAPGTVLEFEALLSLNSVALKWRIPTATSNHIVSIVRLSSGTQAETTIYRGTGLSFVDRNVGSGQYSYVAFLEEGGTIVTSAPPPVICVTLPPDVEPFTDRVADIRLLHPNAFGSDRLPHIVLGPPTGAGLTQGSMNVLSLGAATNDDGGASAPYGGEITLEFMDKVVWDGPGPDFTIFENVFYVMDSDGNPDPENRFMEPAIVSVSQDGINWRRFQTDFSPRYHPDSGKLNLRHPYCYNKGFAGVNPVMSNGYDPDPTDPAVSGGDSFDISEVGMDWIRFIRIQSTGDQWLFDDDGDLIFHTDEASSASRHSRTSGFDLDAVTAIWWQKVESRSLYDMNP